MPFRIWLLTLLFIFAIGACTKVREMNEEPLLVKKDLWPTDYWCKYDYVKNVYEVFRKDSLGTHYLYDDTLRYVKDTLISSNYNIYFKEYTFCRQANTNRYIVGMGGSISQFHISLIGLTYPLFDLNLMKEPYGLAKYISWDGKPFNANADYNVGYRSGFYRGFATKIGICDSVVDATIKYRKEYPNSNGYEILDRRIYLAKNGLGIVQCITHYECKNMPNKNDTIYDLEFKIKKILD